ncbi:nuclease-related domain-containing protein [Sporosarcina sp. FSL W8-0480]|uniref:nuclease-related domain-containing protein n=1 Tax=Sporosarcina sp. FSL W8-0480 TaxID=2954701 RepID=UPI0030DB445E
MIIKKKTNSFKLNGLERLLQRLPNYHSRYSSIENAIKVTRAGENGERILADVFQKYEYPHKHYIFHDLNLRSTGQFQIDTLFLCKQGLIIFEMKNIAGRISFPTDQNQIVRTLENGQIDSFECPSIQLSRNQILLEDWLHARSMSIPIYTAVVFPRPQQRIENNRTNLTILFPLEIPVFLRNIGEQSPTLDDDQLRSIATTLMESHRDYNPFPLSSTYNISPSELKRGVRCVRCGLFGMQSIHKGWGCNRCGHTDSHGHLQGMLDYIMLVNDQITNKECRNFLQLDSHQKANRILKQLDIPSQGEKKGRFYVAGLREIELLSKRASEHEWKVPDW